MLGPQGAQRQKEKDNVFGEGSRAPVAIVFLVKIWHQLSAENLISTQLTTTSLVKKNLLS